MFLLQRLRLRDPCPRQAGGLDRYPGGTSRRMLWPYCSPFRTGGQELYRCWRSGPEMSFNYTASSVCWPRLCLYLPKPESSMRTIAETLAWSCSIMRRLNSRSPKEIALLSSSAKGSSIPPWRRSRHWVRPNVGRGASVRRERIKQNIL